MMSTNTLSNGVEVQQFGRNSNGAGRMDVNEDVLKELAKNERTLWRKFGIRLRVESVSADGSKLICTASRVRWSIIHANMPSYEVVEHASSALACLRRSGVTALVGVIPKRQHPKFKRIDPRTPFGVLFSTISAAVKRQFWDIKGTPKNDLILAA